jgi:hypothetical protein
MFDLPAVLTRLLAMNFFAPAHLVREMLAHDADRKSRPSTTVVVMKLRAACNANIWQCLDASGAM